MKESLRTTCGDSLRSLLNAKSLSKGKEKAQCGWLKYKYGVSWQVVPSALGKMLQDKNAEKSEKVMQALLQMKKIDIKTLKQAFEQQ